MKLVRYRLVRITHETTPHERREIGQTVIISPGRIKKELLWDSVAPLLDKPELEFFVELGVLVENEDDTEHEVDVLDAIEGCDRPVYTYELEFLANQSTARWVFLGVFGNVRSDAELLEELECDNDPEETIIIDLPVGA